MFGKIEYCPFIPVEITRTKDEYESLKRKERANKRYATVKMSNTDCHYRGKCGEIVESSVVGGTYCLLIDTINTVSVDGNHTLIGVFPSSYKRVWFTHDEIENIEEYDSDGNLIGDNCFDGPDLYDSDAGNLES